MVLDFHKSYLLYKFAKLNTQIQDSPVISPVPSPSLTPSFEDVIIEDIEIANTISMTSQDSPISPDFDSPNIPISPNVLTPPRTPKKEVTEYEISNEIQRYIRENKHKLSKLTRKIVKNHLADKLDIDVSLYKEFIKNTILETVNKVEAEMDAEKSNSDSDDDEPIEFLTDTDSPKVEKKKRKTKKEMTAAKESWSDNKLRDMVETLMEWILDDDTKIKDISQESGIETLFYIFQAYYNSKGKEYDIGDYLDFMNEFYNNPKHVYNPFIAKGKTAHTIAHSNKAADVIKKYKNDVHKMSSNLKKIYKDKYDNFKDNRKYLYDIYEGDNKDIIIINPYSGLPSENKRFTDKYVDCIANADEKLGLKGTKRKYYLYLCALKIVKEKNQWKKTMNQICNVQEECTTKCCHKNKCTSTKECEEKKKPKKKSKKKKVIDKDTEKDVYARKKKKKTPNTPSLKDYEVVSDIED